MVWLCCYSYSSLAYDQQYNVGDTGPNGGQVTAVDVTSTVTDTSVALNGGFEETTTTTLFTETVTEQISTTETTTTTSQTTVETTTANQLGAIDSNWSTRGTVNVGPNVGSVLSCNYGLPEEGEACTGPMANVPNSNVSGKINWQPYGTNSLGGGSVNSGYVELTQNLTEAEIQAGFDINYGVDVESHVSNATVPNCANTTGDCQDLIKVTLNLFAGSPDSGGTFITQRQNYETLTYSGTRTYSYTYTLPSNDYDSVYGGLALWGVDAGFHSGMYGPIFSDPYIKLTYDVVTTITEQITNIVLSTQQTVYETSEETMTSVFIGDPTTDTTPIEIDYTDVDSFEIEIVDADGGGIELEFAVEVDETSNTATVEMSSTNLDTGVVQVEQIAEISLDFEMDTGTVDMPEITVAEIEADIGSQIDSAVADAVAEIDAGPTETVDVASVNTSEGNADGPEATQEVSETEGSGSTEASVASENVQESDNNAEQSVEEGGEAESGDSDSRTDSGGTKTATNTKDSKDGEAESNKSSGGKESKGKRGNSKSKQEQKREHVERKVAEAKQKIATRILAAMADTYSAINETTKIALMSSLADQENFNKYLAQKNADLPSWYTSEQVYQNQLQLLDPAGVLYDMAQDKIWEEMIMEQYKEGYGTGVNIQN